LGLTEQLSEMVDSKAEAGIVSTLIYHPEFITHSVYFHEKFFYHTDNACIYWAVKELLNSKITNITALNIEQIISSHPAVKRKTEEYNLPKIQEYIDLCFNSKRDTVEEYLMLVKIVMTLAFKREFLKQSMNWQQMCTKKDVTLEEMSGNIYNDFNSLTTKFVTDGEISTIGGNVMSTWNSIKSIKERCGTYGFPTPYESINNFFHFEDGELYIIEARMKVGKSLLSLATAVNLALQGIPVLIFDTEMPSDQFSLRLISYFSGLSGEKIKHESLTNEENIKIERAIENISKLPIYHHYAPSMTKEQMFSIVAQKKIEVGLKMVIYDYIKGADSIIDSASRSLEMGSLTNFLKNRVAGELKIPVLAFCQLSRTGVVAESDGIERYCTVACKFEEKTPEEIIRDGAECGTHKFTVKLNRLGKNHRNQNDYIDMKFLGTSIRIVEAKKHILEENPFI